MRPPQIWNMGGAFTAGVFSGEGSLQGNAVGFGFGGRVSSGPLPWDFYREGAHPGPPPNSLTPSPLSCPSLEPGGPGGGDPPPFLPRQPEEALPRLEPELEQEPPAWRELAAPDALLRLPQREVRRQEVINGERDPKNHPGKPLGTPKTS